MSKVVIVVIIFAISSIFAGCHTQGPVEADAVNLHAVLSPDGMRIVFCRCFRYQYRGFQVVLDPTPYRTAYDASFVYVIDRTTKKVRRILERGSPHLSWEGDLIAYSKESSCETTWVTYEGTLVPPADIYVMNSDGKNERFAVQGNSPFILLPDAAKLIYRDGLSLFRINVDGTERALIRDLSDLLVDEPAQSGGWYAITWLRNLVWDPNTSKILIGIMPPSAPYSGVWEMNLDGTELRKSSHQFDPYFWTISDKIPYGSGGIDAVLEELTHDITYEEWEVPRPEDFD